MNGMNEAADGRPIYTDGYGNAIIGPLDAWRPIRTSTADRGSFKLAEVAQLRWDDEHGELQTLRDGVVREAIKVRAKLEDDLLRAAVIRELERLGYTVTSPEPRP